MTTINTGHVAEFVTLLRNTEAKQANGTLCAKTEEGYAYCCLGLGSKYMGLTHETVMGRAREMQFILPVEDDDDRTYSALPPSEFAEWLIGPEGVQQSLEDTYGEHAADVVLRDLAWDFAVDWPEGMVIIQRDYPDDEDWYEVSVAHGDITSLATLNDAGFTFAQIADLVDYFGIRKGVM